jgi:Zn-dependent membrane protease YugP
MKGGIEFALVMLFGMMFCAIAIGLIGVLTQLHDARLLQETIVSTVEHHASEQITQQLENQVICPVCSYQLERQQDHRILVTVRFPIRIPVIDYHTFGRISAMTTPIK